MLDSSSREREREEKEDERSGLERYIVNFKVILSKLNHKCRKVQTLYEVSYICIKLLPLFPIKLLIGLIEIKEEFEFN